MRDQTNEDSYGVLRTASMDQSGSHCEASSGWALRNSCRSFATERTSGQAVSNEAAPVGESSWMRVAAVGGRDGGDDGGEDGEDEEARGRLEVRSVCGGPELSQKHRRAAYAF